MKIFQIRKNRDYPLIFSTIIQLISNEFLQDVQTKTGSLNPILPLNYYTITHFVLHNVKSHLKTTITII